MQLIKIINVFLKKIKLKFNLLFKKPTKGIVILTYHGVVDKISNPRLQRNFHTIDEFNQHISILKKKKFQFLNADDLLHFVESPKEIKNKKLVHITFDDGYKNNLQAIKILNNNVIPATFFISTAVIEGEISIWTVNLSLLILEGNCNEIQFENEQYSLENYENRLEVFQKIRFNLKKLNAENRKTEFKKIENQFPKNEIERLIKIHNYFKMLTWQEINQAKSKNIQFHSHGHNHEIQHQNQTIESIETEIALSTKMISEKLQNLSFFFGFPNGNANLNSAEILKKNNYKAAFVLGNKKYFGKEHNFEIPRITPERDKNKFINQILFS